MKKCLVFLALFLSFQSNVNAERLTGPADLRDKPDGNIIVSLNNDADVDYIAFKDGWYMVSVEVLINKTDLTGKDKVNSKAILYNAKNSEVGKTTDIVAIDRMHGVRERKERSSVKIVAYLNKKYIKKTANKPLIIEEYKLPAKNIHDLQRENKCSELAYCLPDEILKKRKEWRAVAATFQHDQLDNKKLGVGRVTPSKVKPAKNDLDITPLTFEIQLGKRTLYSFESFEGTFYRELQKLFAYNGHWFLEYKQRDTSDKQHTEYSGGVVMDGVNLNAHYNVQDIFNYGYINDKPFYFFRSGAKTYGISYAGVALPLEYDEIQHYFCCSDVGVNPRIYKDMIGFFAIRNGSLYYVEAGVY